MIKFIIFFISKYIIYPFALITGFRKYEWKRFDEMPIFHRFMAKYIYKFWLYFLLFNH